MFNLDLYCCFSILNHRSSFVLGYEHWKSEGGICAELAHSTDADVLENIGVFCGQQDFPAYARD